MIRGFHLWEIPHKSAPQSDVPILLKLRRLPHVKRHAAMRLKHLKVDEADNMPFNMGEST